jgi:hypothetical protein
LADAGFALSYPLWLSISDPEYTSFVEDGAVHARDWFLGRMSVLARGIFTLTDVQAGYLEGGHPYLDLAVNGRQHRIAFVTEGAERVAIDRFFRALNGILLGHGVRHLFALVIPTPYPLRLVLLPVADILRLRGEPGLVTSFDFDGLLALGSRDANGPLPRAPSLEEIVPPERQFVWDAESVDEAADYITLLGHMLGPWGEEALRFDRVSCVEGPDDFPRVARRRLTVSRGERTWAADLEGDTDWVDVRGLVALLNGVLAERGSPRRIVELVTDDQCFRVALVSGAEAERLREFFYVP